MCVAHGYPVPSLTWNKGETLLSNNSQSTIYEKQVETQSGVTFVQSILVICSLTQEDAAQYNCSASNNISSTSASFNLTVNRTCMHALEMITVIRWCMRNIVLRSGVARMSKLRGHSEGTLNVCIACIC